MAHIKPNYNKDGEIISYRFFASIQNEQTGKNELVTKTVKFPDGMTPAKASKRMQTEADLWEEEVKKGNVPAKNQTFKHFIEKEFLPVHVRNGKHSESTVCFYQNITDKLNEHFGKKPLNNIRAIDIERYLIDLSSQEYTRGKSDKKHTYSASYVNQHRTVLTVAFDFAEKHGMIEKNPMRYISAVKKERKEVDFLTETEAKKFLSYLNSDASLYWKTAMNILIRCGLRRGELVGLKWQDLDFIQNTLTITRNVINNKETDRKNKVRNTKSVSSDRMVPIDLALHNLLKSWQKAQANEYGADLLPSAFIFGSPIDPYNPIRPDSVTQWLARFNKSHGLRMISPHDLRHTCATLLLANGASVKEAQLIMGHADASTTLKFYCGSDMNALKSASDKLSQALAMGE